MPITGESHNSKVRVYFYALWFIVSALQAYFTNLIPDEAYYWKYSQELAWGYFDHPPFIAVMIKAGYTLLHNELGVRLFSIFAMMGSVYLTERLTRPKSLVLFYCSITSFAILHIIGLLAVPDAPLLFFTACFFFLYRRYTERENLLNVLLLPVCIALLLLSKYHGILVIFFTLLSDLKLLRRMSFWCIVVGSVVLFMPHVLWQHNNGYPSIQYHLFGRNQYHYKPEFTLNYLLATVLIFAPLAGVVIQYYALRRKTTTTFEKALKYNLVGGLLFFFLMSFKGRVEGNWIFYLMIPAICLGYPVLESKPWRKRFIRVSFIISVTLVLVARVVLINGLWRYNTSSEAWNKLAKRMQQTEYIGWDTWARDVQKRSGDMPVAFINSYQKAAEYEFYSGKRAFSLNNIMGRLDQYNIWNYEDELQGKTIFVVPNFYVDSLAKFETNKEISQYSIINPFYSSSNIRIHAIPAEVTTQPGQNIHLDLRFSILEQCTVNALGNPAYPMLVSYQFFNRNGYYSHTVTGLQLDHSILMGRKNLTLDIPAPADKGDFSLFVTVSTGWLPSSINGARVTIHNR